MSTRHSWVRRTSLCWFLNGESPKSFTIKNYKTIIKYRVLFFTPCFTQQQNVYSLRLRQQDITHPIIVPFYI